MQLTSTTGDQDDDYDDDKDEQDDDHDDYFKVTTMMMILTGDPDRACRVACQDSKISYRFIDKLLIILMLVTFMVLLVQIFWQVSTSLHWVSHLFSPLSLSP